MERWKIYAFTAALFAGLTSILAKSGLKEMSADLGLAVRTVFVVVFVLANLFVHTAPSENAVALRMAGWKPVAWLALSAVTTSLSWICYYRAMKEGAVSFVALVDKGSILVTLLLSILVLGEPLTWRMAAGATLIVAGLLVLAGGK